MEGGLDIAWGGGRVRQPGVEGGLDIAWGGGRVRHSLGWREG